MFMNRSVRQSSILLLSLLLLVTQRAVRTEQAVRQKRKILMTPALLHLLSLAVIPALTGTT